LKLLPFILAFIAVPGRGNHSDHHPSITINPNRQIPDHEKAGWTPIPNMAAALKGYNPFIADRFVSGRPDPGIRHQIFESTYIDEDGTPQIYGNIKWSNDIHCSVDSTATVARNMQELEEQTREYQYQSDWDIQTANQKTGFILKYKTHSADTRSRTRSSSFAKREKFFQETQGEVFLNEATCAVFKVDIDSTKPEFSGGFIAGKFSISFVQCKRNLDLQVIITSQQKI